MNRDETITLLRTRSALTSQPYSDDVADAWHEALADWTFTQTRTALIRAARQHQRVTVAHLVELLPARPAPQLPLPPEPVGEQIDLREYLARLERRAAHHPSAAVELEHWHRLAARQRHPSSRDTGPAVIGPPT